MRPFVLVGIVALTAITAASAQTPMTQRATGGRRQMDVYLDRAEISPLPAKTATLVVGNPMIADASVQTGNLIVITGKGVGSTNVMAVDSAGNVLSNLVVRVRQARDETLQVYRGVDRETYQCTPVCEATVSLGDGKDHFDKALAQGSLRMRSAQDQNTVERH